MTTVDITSPAGKIEGALTLPALIFDAQVNIPVMHQVVVAQLAAARQGTHSTKTRGNVAGGGAKPYRQKGTGRARQGSIRAPQFVGGGVVHGPTPHGYDQRTPKKMKAAALRGALSDRARNDQVHVLSAIIDGDVPSTKAATAALAAVRTGGRVLVIVTRDDDAAKKSLRNLSGVHLLPSDQLNTYDVLRADDVVFTRAALDAFLVGAGAEAATETAARTDSKPAAKKPAEKKPTENKPTEKKPAASKPTAKAPATEAPAQAPAKEAAAQAPAKEAAAKPAAAKKPAAQPAAEKAALAADSGDDTAAEAPDFGAGSHAPLDDDSEPKGFPVKGNASSKLYHLPGTSHYSRTVAEVWFDTAESAESAGFQLPPSQRKAAEDANEEESK